MASKSTSNKPQSKSTTISAPKQTTRQPSIPQRPQFHQTTYTSDPVPLPETFLIPTTPPASNPPITLHPIDFAASPLPEYSDCTALILDNVLTPHECATLLDLTATSASTSGGWRPAMVNAGQNLEILDTSYRNSDRIIWDNVDLVDRIWKRCLRAEGLERYLGFVEGNPSIQGKRGAGCGEKWRFTRLNERMRFLRYGEGQFFQPHCDGSYVNPDAPEAAPERSLFTLQLYLNNSATDSSLAKPSGGADLNDNPLTGGATSFLASRWGSDARLDVAAKTGRVLIFQQRSLVHEGQEVLSGVKYTMRTDLMYERLGKD